MRVLVTRPIDDAEETAAQLRARGHVAVIAPLLSVRYHDGHPLHLDDVQAILATSANGVRAFARRTARRDLPVFAVGSQTAQAARDAGFEDIRNADGDANALAKAARGWAKPESGILLHACGAEAEGRLAADLRAAGFSVRNEVLYGVPAAHTLPAAARDALAAGAIDAVLIFSARSAQAFVDGVSLEGFESACAPLTACCISEAAARPLPPAMFAEIRVAARPNQAALLDLLERN